MAVYVPRFETQRDERVPLPWTNCNAAAHAMLVDLWTHGRTDISDVDVRRASTVPLYKGMNYRAVALALKKLLPALGDLRYSDIGPNGEVWTSPAAMTWAQLRTHLANGGGAVVNGTYSRWANHKNKDGLLLRRWQLGGTFLHSVFVCDYRPQGDESVLIMDPLGHGNYAGDRAHINALWAFIWRTGSQNASVRVSASHGFTSARQTSPPPPPPDYKALYVAEQGKVTALASRVGTIKRKVATHAADVADD